MANITLDRAPPSRARHVPAAPRALRRASLLIGASFILPAAPV